MLVFQSKCAPPASYSFNMKRDIHCKSSNMKLEKPAVTVTHIVCVSVGAFMYRVCVIDCYFIHLAFLGQKSLLTASLPTSVQTIKQVIFHVIIL